MEPAEEQYARYSYQYGYPPKQPQHLVAFAKKNGVKVSWGQAKKLLKAAPDTSNYVPPADDEELPASTSKMLGPAPSEEEKVSIAKRYSNPKLDVSQPKLAGVNKRSSASRYQYLISQLVAMGFNEEQSLAALRASKGNLQLAIESLMSGEINRPMIHMNRNKKDNNTPTFANNNSGKRNRTHTTVSNFNRFVKRNSRNNNTNNSANNNSNNGNNIGNMKVKALITWLEEIDMAQYQPLLVAHGFNPSNIHASNMTALTDDRLKAMGIQLGAHRKIILDHALAEHELQVQQQLQKTPTRKNTAPTMDTNTPNIIKQNSSQLQALTEDKPQEPSVNETQDAFEKLLSGHASIRQRLKAMQHIYDNLDSIDISADNGRLLLNVFMEQIMHEDYIYHDYSVRFQALKQMADVFIFVLNRIHYHSIPDLVNTSLSELINYLFKLIDDNRAKKFHGLAVECLDEVLDALVGKRNKTALIDACGLLNEKTNMEQITQVNSRFIAAKQMFQRIIFGGDVDLVNTMFNIDINAYNNRDILPKYNDGIPSNEFTMPQNRTWVDIFSNNQRNDEEDTFYDIVADTVGLMMLDPNSDMGVIGSNLAVYFTQLNADLPNNMEKEAKYRFNKFYHAPTPLKPVTQQPQPTKQATTYEHNKEPVDYRIKQQTEVRVAAPVLPSI